MHNEQTLSLSLTHTHTQWVNAWMQQLMWLKWNEGLLFINTLALIQKKKVNSEQTCYSTTFHTHKIKTHKLSKNVKWILDGFDLIHT